MSFFFNNPLGGTLRLVQKEPPVEGVAQLVVPEVLPEVGEDGAVDQMKDVFQHQKEISLMEVHPHHAGTESPLTSHTPIHAGVVLPIAEVALVGVGVIPGLLSTVVGRGKIQIYQNGLMKMSPKPPNLVEVLIHLASSAVIWINRGMSYI